MANAKFKYPKILILALAFLVLSATPAPAEEEISYDSYASDWKYPYAHKTEEAQKAYRTEMYKRALEHPFRPLGHMMGKSAEWTEREHVDDKITWFFDTLDKHGITPTLRRPTDGSVFTTGLGGTIQLDKLLKMQQKQYLVEVFGGWTPNFDFVGSTADVGARYKIEIPATKRLYHEGVFTYRRSSSENFFGIGQHSSRGNWTTYSPEETKLFGKLGYEVTDTISTDLFTVFQRMKIGNGNRERVGKIKEYFHDDESLVPGLNGETLLGVGTLAKHDTRDYVDDAKHGGYQEAEFSFFHDVEGHNISYLKFAASAAHFVPLWSDRRILAARVAFEQNKSVGTGNVPFFNMARLGGGKRANGSDLLRSYRFNRFFDEGLLSGSLEYRYSIWEYGHFGTDAVALFDLGEVFHDLRYFMFKELRWSYGGALNFKFRRKTFLSLSAANGDEGIRLGLNTKISF